MNKSSLLLIVLMLLIKPMMAQTYVPVLINSNQTWTASGNPYILLQNTVIDTGATVKVMPGVIIKSFTKKISVLGSFECFGSSDSLIHIDTTNIEYSNKSKDFNANTGTGAYFNFTQFNYVFKNSIPYCITTNSTSLKVENCIFNLGYYGIYVNGSIDSIKTEVFNSKFYGSNSFSSNSGYPIYGSSPRGRFIIINNEFYKLYSIFLSGSTTFNENICDDLSNFQVTQQFDDLNIKCNKFLNMGRNIDINSMNFNGLTTINFQSNTLNNICRDNGFTNYYMLNINRSIPANTKIKIDNNNFLFHGAGNNFKLKITGKNGGSSAIDSIDARNNFWNTTDSNTIESFCFDYKDDANLPRIIFSKFEIKTIVGCSNDFKCAQPNFSYSINNYEVSFVDSIKSTEYYKAFWKFGDGNISYLKNPKHTYLQDGNYNVCLFVTDTFGSVCDSFCKTINIKNLKCRAFFKFGVDTNLTKKIFILINSKNSSVYKYTWSYGPKNGPLTSSNQKTPEITYSNKGIYKVCLTIYDSILNCVSTFCDEIYIDSNYTQMVFLDQNILSNQDIQSLKHQINVFPNPNNGLLNVSFESLNSETLYFNIYNSLGQKVKQLEFNIEQGSQTINADLQDLNSGVYWIHLNSSSINRNIKFQIIK